MMIIRSTAQTPHPLLLFKVLTHLWPLPGFTLRGLDSVIGKYIRLCFDGLVWSIWADNVSIRIFSMRRIRLWCPFDPYPMNKIVFDENMIFDKKSKDRKRWFVRKWSKLNLLETSRRVEFNGTIEKSRMRWNRSISLILLSSKNKKMILSSPLKMKPGLGQL